MKLSFTKMQGLGNDFVVIDAYSQPISLTNAQIKKIADRHFGVGCDQLLIVEKPSNPSADFRYRIFNADGGEVEQCGNGARCFVRFVHDKKLTQKSQICVETASGIIYPKLEENGLIEVDGLPTWFLKISKDALKKVWDASEEYTNEGKVARMVFDIKIMNGQLVSEDIVFCRKWHDLGGKVYIDPSMTCNHVGIKKYIGNFMEYIKAIGALK